MGNYRRPTEPKPRAGALQQATVLPQAASVPSSSASVAHLDNPGLPPVMSWPLNVVSLLTGLTTLLVWRGRVQPDDWASLWIGGLLMDTGQQSHLYDADLVDFSAMRGDAWLGAALQVSAPFPHPYVQNPLFAEVLGWLTHIMSFDASAAWLLFFSGAAIVVFIASSYYLWFRTPMPWGVAVLVCAGVLALPTTINSLWLGQTTPLIVAGVAYGLAASRIRPWLAGIILGLVASIKLTPFVLVVVMLFFAYRRRAALWSLATTAVLAAWMLISVDAAVISDWIDRISDISGAVLVSAANQSLASAMTADRAIEGLPVTIVRDYPDSATMVPIAVAIVATLVTTAVAWWNRVYRFEILIVGAWLIATTFSAIVWTHYMLALVTPVMGFAAMARTRLTRQWPYLGIAALVVLLSFPVTNPIAAAPFTSGFSYSGLTAMLVALVLLLVIGAYYAAAVGSGGGIDTSAADAGGADAGTESTVRGHAAKSVGVNPVQPEPMVLFDLFDGWRSRA